MNTHYEPYWQQAVQLRSQTHQFLGDSSHPIARALHQDSSMLVEDIEMDRQPRAIEDRITGLQSRLAHARTMGDEILSVPKNQDLHGRLEKMREGFRQMPHY